MIKLLLIGNSGVGKSSILLQYSDKKFVHNYYNTIGVDYVLPLTLRKSSS
jgi:GTPase SAR1 family protein